MTEQLYQRRRQVRNALLAGVPRKQIVEKCMTAWKISERSVDRLISKAQKELQEQRRQDELVQRKRRLRVFKERDGPDAENRKIIDGVMMDIISGRKREVKIFNTAGGLVEREVDIDPDTVTRAAAIYLRLQILDSETKKREEAQILCEEVPELRKADVVSKQITADMQKLAEDSASKPGLSEETQ